VSMSSEEPDWGELFDVRDLAVAYGREQPDDQDNYRYCPRGRHWGADGAAGIIPWCRHRGRLYVLLSLRSGLVQDGGCWSILGGARDEGEPPWLAAIRESHEEAHVHLSTRNLRSSVRWECPECSWTYMTFLAEVRAGQTLPAVRIRRTAAWETAKLAWFPAERVAGLHLHPGLSAVWPEIQGLLA
jgi:8-oxo-dGTP diphosphatase